MFQQNIISNKNKYAIYLFLTRYTDIGLGMLQFVLACPQVAPSTSPFDQGYKIITNDR